MAKRALITGITGQDGSYLAEFLLQKNYKVHGTVRLTGSGDFSRLEAIKDQIQFHPVNLVDQTSLLHMIEQSEPDEIYNLAAQSFVAQSWKEPVLTGELTGLCVTKILEAIRKVNKNIRFYQASSSEMYGQAREVPQTEMTPFYPKSPYGVSKVYGHHITVNYRESYGLFAVSGILFNHESPRRSLQFVTRKITNGVAKIKTGEMKKLVLGYLENERDWGYAKDYVEAMWLMLQHKSPEDFVIATGTSHTVRDFAEGAFAEGDLDYRDFVEFDKGLLRPAEVNHLRGNYAKAKSLLGWEPRTSFRELIKIMVESDLKLQGALV